MLCYSKLQSSLAALLPIVSDWSPLLPQCTPGWGPQWPLASAECPRSAPDGHHLKIVQMDPISMLLSGCAYCFLRHYRKTEQSVCEQCIDLPAVQMWQEECGAHAMPLTQARWLFSRATGVHGTLTSSIITCNRETCQHVNGMVQSDYNVACCFMFFSSRNCVIPVVCVKLGKWYAVKHNCVTWGVFNDYIMNS